MAIARTFPSGLDYGETLIYPSLGNLCETILKRTKYLFNLLVGISSSVKQSMSFILSCNEFKKVVLRGVWLILVVPAAVVYWIFHLILLLLLMVYFPFFMVYFLFWKVAMRVVPPIWNMEQKKKEYDDAKVVLDLVCKKIKEHTTDYPSFYTGPVLEAARQNADEVVAEILKTWPEAIRCQDENGYDIIQLATIHRSEKIYNLIYIIGERKSIYRTMEDSSMNNMLHLAGRLAPSNKLKLRTGAALQLQRELQWREEVKELVFPAYATKENIFKDTPEMVFSKEHEALVKEGEKWIKTVAESCSITAALITTIVFAAAITVPGGSTQETGVPVFMKETAFTVFAIADAISLFSSATALLVFLSILTARFAEQDFLVRLPRRLIIGLCSLLLSTTAMMVAFGATLFLVFCHDKFWMLAPLCGLAFLPIAIFFILQFPLILDLFRSTYISKFGKSNHHSSKFNLNDIRFFFAK
ncbi:putative PGG domain-containing protein [Helianthus annuus]|nr:putative PGG domain-containing protein [Helianthus annuus]